MEHHVTGVYLILDWVHLFINNKKSGQQNFTA